MTKERERESERERKRERKRERESLLRECTTRISSSSARLFIKKYPDTSPKNIFTHLAHALKRKELPRNNKCNPRSRNLLLRFSHRRDDTFLAQAAVSAADINNNNSNTKENHLSSPKLAPRRRNSCKS